MMETNREQLEGYGEDVYCIRAKEKIRKLCKDPDADVHFLTGGTQANATIIDALLWPYQGVITAETGTLYTKKELKAIYEVCRKFEIPLFLDGARMAYGIGAKNTDVSIADIAELTDVFYIGGTKVGAMFGEAVVITNLLQYIYG